MSQQLASHFLRFKCFPGTLFNFFLDIVTAKWRQRWKRCSVFKAQIHKQGFISNKLHPAEVLFCRPFKLLSYRISLFTSSFLFSVHQKVTHSPWDLCVSVLVAAGVSAWMTVPPRGIWPPRLLASVCATPRTTSASCSMARTLHSATKLMWVLCTWASGIFQKVGLFLIGLRLSLRTSARFSGVRWTAPVAPNWTRL